MVERLELMQEKARLLARKWALSLKAETEDIEQELLIFFLGLTIRPDANDYEAGNYLWRAGEKFLADQRILEHEAGLWLEEAYEEDERPGSVNPDADAIETMVTRSGRTIVLDEAVKARRDRRAASSRRHYEAHRDAECQAAKDRYWADREAKLQYQRDYDEAHKEARRAYKREWYRRKRANEAKQGGT